MNAKPFTIRKSPTADTRTCDWSTVSKEQLLESSVQHICDVRLALSAFSEMLQPAGQVHDHDKLSDIDGFHADFSTGFKEQGWWNRHRNLNRHHLNNSDGIPPDVDLIDVLEYIADCVVAGMARSGSVYDITLPDEVLLGAFDMMVYKLRNAVKVTE